ncbi:nuclease-related domain-containing protein [Pseudogracilibacillus auburnensis]|uniref:nuclease-related domain-containing protein n=1 Tax=Pseudogracilibacillus auburnensis TaxID=1494959 RepID=UPI001A9579D7|nr:nuclease-related domain-containing protein [Pseudogracilibacillus auburnensis]MBO1005998.1 NERD domain-containing protein [Pseudogracilibacillus auburnensis]
MKLSSSQKNNLDNLNKGYEGERRFFELLEEELIAECVPLYGLQFEVNQTEFQIDSLLIFQNTLDIFEIKNYDDDYYIEGEKWHAVSGKEIRNPTHQLKRCEILFRQLLQQLGYNFPVNSYLVFVNPEFYLYQAPFNQSVIFPTQLLRLTKKLNSMGGKITQRHMKLANQLALRHIPMSAHERIPEYSYEDLKKGIVCTSCRGFLSVINNERLKCSKCGNEDSMESAIMRSVAEFHLLFPNRKITISAISEWCLINTKKTLRRILMKNMKCVRKGRFSYYTFI